MFAVQAAIWPQLEPGASAVIRLSVGLIIVGTQLQRGSLNRFHPIMVGSSYRDRGSSYRNPFIAEWFSAFFGGCQGPYAKNYSGRECMHVCVCVCMRMCVSRQLRLPLDIKVNE